MLLFDKFPEVMVNQMGDKLKQCVQQAAALACDGHPVIGKAEFTVLVMKFGNNKVVYDTVAFLDKKISKMIDFDQAKSSYVEEKSIFVELLMHFESDKDLIRNEKIELLQEAFEARLTQERARVTAAREAKSEPTVYKTEAEVLQLETCYMDALNQVAPRTDLKGLSALEYCTMCIYYDSQPYPNQFLERVGEGDHG